MDITSDPSGYWDRSASSKIFAHPLDHARFVRTVPRDAPILDYVSGHGRLCDELALLGFRDVRGVDSSPVMIQTARSRHPDLAFSVVERGAMPFPDASLGAVLLFAVLTCIASPDDQKRLIAEIHRVLRPGGCLLISDYPLQHDARNRDRYERDHEEFGLYGTFRLVDGAVVRRHGSRPATTKCHARQPVIDTRATAALQRRCRIQQAGGIVPSRPKSPWPGAGSIVLVVCRSRNTATPRRKCFRRIW